tara:strand:- start:959 stop:1762 length:804 start_codon:yes stop_codon:yes gene_type:complete
MSINNKQIRDISIEIAIKGVSNFAKNKINKNSTSKFQPLDILMPQERKIRSIVGGLETSLGTTLWEPLIKELGKSNGFEIISKNLEAPICKKEVESEFDSIRSDRTHKRGKHDSQSAKKAIKKLFEKYQVDDWKLAPPGKGVDIWMKRDGVNYLFDSKTVQPNKGNFKDFCEQILTWYYYFYSKYDEPIEAKILFPYNPHDKFDLTENLNFYKKHNISPLEYPSESICGSEFWNFICDNENAWSCILESFEEIKSKELIKKELESLF